jgi:DNA-binding GntR family transcriptional regulator
VSPLKPAPIVAATNLTVEVYERLRKAIVEGSIRPNERLIESDLAERLNVSRTPVRESMLRLAGDGLIMSVRRGWVVREHSAQEIRQVYEVRAALEGFAAYLAAERASDEELANIEAIHLRYSEQFQGSSRGERVAHNDEFHEAIIAATHNELLAQRIHDNSQYYFIHRIAGFLTDDEVDASIVGHGEQVQALLARDSVLAERIVRSHVLRGLDKVLAKIN